MKVLWVNMIIKLVFNKKYIKLIYFKKFFFFLSIFSNMFLHENKMTDNQFLCINGHDERFCPVFCSVFAAAWNFEMVKKFILSLLFVLIFYTILFPIYYS